jgi:hypothetical protein
MILLPFRKLIVSAFALAEIVLIQRFCHVAMLSITGLPGVSLKASAASTDDTFPIAMTRPAGLCLGGDFCVGLLKAEAAVKSISIKVAA